ncbi:MAG TPA: TetR/AcrR family transcriptional regulator [Burkholderiaceae bacterium]|nr:TetR/AcrR family transcriptional regulator [Burkholderiaceae bacterium]
MTRSGLKPAIEAAVDSDSRPVRPARKTRVLRPKTLLRHEDRRVEILRAAARLFATYGYEPTSLDMIADQLGMHKATLYHYINSKEEVLYQCLVRSFEDLDEVIEATQDRKVPVVERLRRFALSLARAQNNEFGRCLALVGSRPLASMSSRSIRDFQRRLDGTVRALVEEGVATGVLKQHEPGLVSAILFGSLNWVPHWFRRDGRLSLEEVVDAFLDMLIDGLRRDAWHEPSDGGRD